MNIVELYITLINIKKLHADGFRWLSVDMDGELFAFKHKPSIDNNRYWFEETDINNFIMCVQYINNVNINDWKESLWEIKL